MLNWNKNPAALQVFQPRNPFERRGDPKLQKELAIRLHCASKFIFYIWNGSPATLALHRLQPIGVYAPNFSGDKREYDSIRHASFIA
jgi:hypothetical protein